MDHLIIIYLLFNTNQTKLQGSYRYLFRSWTGENNSVYWWAGEQLLVDLQSPDASSERGNLVLST